MVIQIDKNIPVPAETEVSRNTIYPWLEMGIGDSFFQAPHGSEDQKVLSQENGVRKSQSTQRAW